MSSNESNEREQKECITEGCRNPPQIGRDQCLPCEDGIIDMGGGC